MARVQGFPDDLKFQGRVTTGAHRRRFEALQHSQVDNAVSSPFLGLAVGTMLAQVLAMRAVTAQSVPNSNCSHHHPLSDTQRTVWDAALALLRQ